MIKVTDIAKTWTGKDENIHALEKLSLSIKQGEFVSIIGPSGCGKSTLLKIIGDLIEPNSGAISIDGKSTTQARREHFFSFVFQNPVLFPWRNVLENIQLPREIVTQNGIPPSKLLEMVGLTGRENQYPHELSGGMQQRVALARALSFNPKILLMDEPFSAVDEFTRQSLNLELLKIWDETQLTILFITHSISEAIFLSDRVIVLSNSPANVRHTLEVSFSRPRDHAITESAKFQEEVKCLRAMLE